MRAVIRGNGLRLAKMAKYITTYCHNRNYGCRYKEIIENGYRSLILENEKIRVSIYIDKGSDIYELLYKPADIDFMWKSPLEINGNRKTPFAKESSDGCFSDIYEGGWQDILPNIGDPTDYKNIGLGLHGELFTLPFNYEVLKDSPGQVRVRLFTRMKRAPLFVEKELVIESDKSFLEINQSILNEAEEDFNFSWGQHPAIGVPFLDENCVMDIPEAEKAGTYKSVVSPNQMIPADTEFEWPMIKDNNGNMLDLSKVLSQKEKAAFVIYLKNVSEGWYAITSLKKNLGFGMIWDKNIFKHIWIWAVYKGYYGYPWYGRTYNIALEPWSSLPDNFDEVLKNGDFISLKPGKSLNTKYTAVVYESDKRVKGFKKDYNPINK